MRQEFMQKRYKHIVFLIIAILVSSMAGITNIALNAKIQSAITVSQDSSQHNNIPTAIIDVVSHHSPCILSSQEHFSSFLFQCGSKNQTTYRTDALRLQTYLYTAYKKRLQEKAQYLSQLRSDGHYLYALCQMRI